MTTTSYLMIMAALVLCGTVAVVTLATWDRRQKQECTALPPLPRVVPVPPLPPAPQLQLAKRSPYAPKPKRERNKLVGVFLQAKLEQVERWRSEPVPPAPKPSAAQALLPSIDWGKRPS